MKRFMWPLMEIVVSFVVGVLVVILLGAPVKLALLIAVVVLVLMVVSGRYSLKDRLAKPGQKTDEGLAPGTWSVVGVIHDPVLVRGGSIERDVVLVLRRLEAGSRERYLYVISDGLLGDIYHPLRSALAKNGPKFCFLVEPDGQSAILYQDRSDGERLYELKLNLDK